MVKHLEEVFLKVIQEKGKEIAERLTKEYSEKFNRELNEEITKIGLNVAKQVSFQFQSDNLIVTLKDERKS